MEQIFAAIVQASQPGALPSAWSHIPCHSALVRLPSDGAAFLAELRRKFTLDQLRQAGVVTLVADGEVALHPQLAANSLIWAIRSAGEKQVTSLIANGQVWPPDTEALAAAWPSSQPARSKGAKQPIIVAYSLEDLAILQSLGLAAVPGSDWSRWHKPQLDYFCKKLQIIRRKGAAPIVEQPMTLVLANWRLATLERADVCPAMNSWSHLVALSRHLGLRLESVGLWKPSEQHLQHLRYELRYLELPQIAASLQQGIKADTRELVADLHPTRPPPKTILEAHRAWRQAARNPANPFASQKTFQELGELIERQRLEPLVDAALRTQCPLERNALLALAETIRLLQPQLWRLEQKALHSRCDADAASRDWLTPEELDAVLKLLDRQLALTKEVIACRRNPPALQRQARPPTAARSRTWPSPPKK